MDCGKRWVPEKSNLVPEKGTEKGTYTVSVNAIDTKWRQKYDALEVFTFSLVTRNLHKS
jgi:hypothetical protein